MSGIASRPNHGANIITIDFGKSLTVLPQSGRHLADLILKDSMLFTGVGAPMRNPVSYTQHNIDQIEAHLDSIAEKILILLRQRVLRLWQAYLLPNKALYCACKKA